VHRDFYETSSYNALIKGLKYTVILEGDLKKKIGAQMLLVRLPLDLIG